MPSAASIGADFSAYQGNAALGGGSFGELKFDLSAFDRLAQYTFLQNQELYKNKRADIQAAMKEMGALMTLDLGTARSGDRKAIADEYNKLINEFKQDPEAFNNMNTDKFMNFKAKLGNLSRMIASGSTRAATYNSVKTAIESDPLLVDKPEVKKLRLKELEETFDKSTVNDEFAGIPQYMPKKYTEQKAALGYAEATKDTGNNFVTYKMNYFDPSASKAAAGANIAAEDLLNLAGDDQESVLNRAFYGDVSKGISETDAFNAALPGAYKVTTDAAGKVVKTFDRSKAAQPVANIYDLAQRYNDYALKKRADVSKGVFTTTVEGQTITLGTSITADRFQSINIEDGLSREEYKMLQDFAEFERNGGDKVQTATSHHGTGTQKYNAQTSRINANKPSGSGGSGGQIIMPVIQPYNNYADHVNRIKSYMRRHNGIPPEPTISQIDADTKSALGIDKEGKYSGKKVEKVRYNKDGSATIITSDKEYPVLNSEIQAGYMKSFRGGNTLTDKYIDEASMPFQYYIGGGTGFESDGDLQKLSTSTGGSASGQQPKSEGSTISINDIPIGSKVETKNGRNYYNGKEVIP